MYYNIVLTTAMFNKSNYDRREHFTNLELRAFLLYSCIYEQYFILQRIIPLGVKAFWTKRLSVANCFICSNWHF